eukprot:SM000033S12351  [mRNA]  locus=s33:382454:387103:- [translate_table: standard]
MVCSAVLMLSALSVFYGTVFSGKLRAKPPPPGTRGAWEVAAGGAAGEYAAERQRRLRRGAGPGHVHDCRRAWPAASCGRRMAAAQRRESVAKPKLQQEPSAIAVAAAGGWLTESTWAHAGGGRSGSAARRLEASPLLSFLKSAHRQEQASFLRGAEDGGQEVPAAAADQDGGSSDDAADGDGGGEGEAGGVDADPESALREDDATKEGAPEEGSEEGGGNDGSGRSTPNPAAFEDVSESPDGEGRTAAAGAVEEAASPRQEDRDEAEAVEAESQQEGSVGASGATPAAVVDANAEADADPAAEAERQPAPMAQARRLGRDAAAATSGGEGRRPALAKRRKRSRRRSSSLPLGKAFPVCCSFPPLLPPLHLLPYVSRRNGGGIRLLTMSLPSLSLFRLGIKVCESQYEEITPCNDRSLQQELKLKINVRLGEHYERHCPPPDRRLKCLIPPPKNYKLPIRWPASRDHVWKANVPHVHLAFEKSDQRWMVVEGDRISFPGGGTHFHDGADKYISHLGQLLGDRKGSLALGGRLRQVLDIGCGVASFGAFLLPHDILAMSLAPNDGHENQIQFALERGIPATLGVLGTRRLLYPSRSFELAHCSRCRIDWAQRDGILLLEVDRVLRPGGYFAWSAPPAYSDDEAEKAIWAEVSDLASRMCWTVAARGGQTVIFRKPRSSDCHAARRGAGALPPLCPAADDADAAWQVPMKACITPIPASEPPIFSGPCWIAARSRPPWPSSSPLSRRHFGSSAYLARQCCCVVSEKVALARWPMRLSAPPPRLADLGLSRKDYRDDTAAWKARTDAYMATVDVRVARDAVRNVMDMRAGLGGFAAALASAARPLWVMNVAPPSDTASLAVVYDRGLLGMFHDWCEAFSTYPRTYDLLHAWHVASDVVALGCGLDDLLLEMDRILRPAGVAIFRDTPRAISEVERRLDAMRWAAWAPAAAVLRDSLSEGDESVLYVQKRLWHAGDSVEPLSHQAAAEAK